MQKKLDGSIEPITHFIKIQMGKSDLDVQDEFWNSILNQIINVGKVLLQNSVNLIGWPVISVSAGPLINLVLNNYQF